MSAGAKALQAYRSFQHKVNWTPLDMCLMARKLHDVKHRQAVGRCDPSITAWEVAIELRVRGHPAFIFE